MALVLVLLLMVVVVVVGRGDDRGGPGRGCGANLCAKLSMNVADRNSPVSFHIATGQYCFLYSCPGDRTVSVPASNLLVRTLSTIATSSSLLLLALELLAATWYWSAKLLARVSGTAGVSTHDS